MIDINKVVVPDVDQLLKEYRGIFESGKLTNNGPCVQGLEEQLDQYHGTRHCLCVSNGTIALHLALRAIHKKGEVITTPFSCIASTSCIIWEGNTPVFCDIDPCTLNINPDLIEEKITDKTVAILGVHVFGNPCRVDAIDEIAGKYSLPVIYDGAQAFGSIYNGQSVLKYGHISTLSLHAYKVVSSVEGGALFTNDSEIFEVLYQMRYFGKDRCNDEKILGTNAKMSELHAAYGLLSLRRADEELKYRKRLAAYYMDTFRQVKGIQLQSAYDLSEPNYSYFPVILESEEKADGLWNFARDRGVVFRKYFYPAINSIPYINQDPRATPVALDISRRVLCIPIHSHISDMDSKVITDTILEYLNI